jgi:hypothetical protein
VCPETLKTLKPSAGALGPFEDAVGSLLDFQVRMCAVWVRVSCGRCGGLVAASYRSPVDRR